MKANESLLAPLPEKSSAVTYSEIIQARAAEIHFDWRNASEVIGVLKEEIMELEKAINENEGQEAIVDELGDILFTCVNLARHLNTTVETSLDLANKKFTRRFQGVEALLEKAGLEFESLSFDELLTYWAQAKKRD